MRIAQFNKHCGLFTQIFAVGKTITSRPNKNDKF